MKEQFITEPEKVNPLIVEHLTRSNHLNINSCIWSGLETKAPTYTPNDGAVEVEWDEDEGSWDVSGVASKELKLL